MPDSRDLHSAAPLRARRNLRWVAAGILAICLGGLGSVMLYTSLAGTRPVVAITRTVYRDQIITDADLGVVTVAASSGFATVAADRLPEVVGTSALTDLTEGSLLNPRMYGDPSVEAGSALLGLKLAAGRLPSTVLAPGTVVLLVPVGRDGADPPSGASVAARVAGAAATHADGASLIDVKVPESEAERVARLAAADQLVLVRAGGSRR